MKKLSILARGLLITGFALGGVLAAPASADEAEIDVDFSGDCTDVEATSSKDISNVVVEWSNGEIEKFEPIGETFWNLTGDRAIATIWVKSGNNGSPDGPGYGERFDCSVVESTQQPTPETKDEPKKADEPKKDDEPKTSGGDAVVDAECVEGGILVTSSKDISNVVLRFETGEDLKIDGLSGTRRLIDVPDGRTVVTVFIKSGDNASGEGPGYGEPVDVDCDEDIAPVNNTNPNPTAPTKNNPGDTNTDVDGTTDTKKPKVGTQPVGNDDGGDEVLGVEFEKPLASAPTSTAVAPHDTSVLGTVLTKGPQVASAALARTGSSPIALSAIALTLVLAGTTIVRRARRSTLG